MCAKPRLTAQLTVMLIFYENGVPTTSQLSMSLNSGGIIFLQYARGSEFVCGWWLNCG